MHGIESNLTRTELNTELTLRVAMLAYGMINVWLGTTSTNALPTHILTLIMCDDLDIEAFAAAVNHVQPYAPLLLFLLFMPKVAYFCSFLIQEIMPQRRGKKKLP